jgi:hypothetical protein
MAKLRLYRLLKTLGFTSIAIDIAVVVLLVVVIWRV